MKILISFNQLSVLLFDYYSILNEIEAIENRLTGVLYSVGISLWILSKSTSVSRLLFVSVCLVGVVGGLPLPALLEEAAFGRPLFWVVLLFIEATFDLSFLPLSSARLSLPLLVCCWGFGGGGGGGGASEDSSSDRAPRDIKNRSGRKWYTICLIFCLSSFWIAVCRFTWWIISAAASSSIDLSSYLFCYSLFTIRFFVGLFTFFMLLLIFTSLRLIIINFFLDFYYVSLGISLWVFEV